MAIFEISLKTNSNGLFTSHTRLPRTFIYLFIYETLTGRNKVKIFSVLTSRAQPCSVLNAIVTLACFVVAGPIIATLSLYNSITVRA